ncbi:hypothetical protein JTB14_025296 [Gonioctena quinquepunctata]|nr:hypothetical protein JTB14_025296 [Gonioctena quinquepunctata]
MAIEHSGIKIMTDSIKTKLLDMEIDADNTGNAFIGKASKRRSWAGNTGDVRKTDRDSVGASAHLTPNRQWLSDGSEQPADIQEIVVANNLKLSVECVGIVNIMTMVEDFT